MSEQIARLTFEELSPRLQTVLKAKVDRLGYLGEFFRCTGHASDILAPFMEMTAALKDALPDRLTELGALTIAGLMNNDYERNQHERLSLKLGFGKEWIAQVERLSPDDASSFSDDEKAVQRLVIAAVNNAGAGVKAQLDDVVGRIGTQQTLAILFLVGRYLTHAIIVNALELAPPVPSIFSEDEQA